MADEEASANHAGTFITIYPWMLRLDMTHIETFAYALIFRFSQDGKNEFRGSQQYIADWCKICRQNVNRVLRSLESKGYILKRVEVINKVKFCRYSVNLCFIPVSSRVKDANERV